MTASYRDQARLFGPYAVMYALGLLTFWGASAMFGGSADDGTATVTATTYVSEGVSRQVASRRGSDDLPTRVVHSHQPSSEDLIEAAREGDLHSVRRLIARRVDVNSVDPQGRTPLMLAAAAGEAGVAALLIEAGAKLNVKSKNGETALMNAAKRGDSETVALLIEHDASVIAKNTQGSTAHDLAIRNNHDTIARLIADEIDRQNRDRILITRAQFLLAKLGYKPGGIDGDLGPKTEDAIVRFQRDQDLTPNGKVTDSLLVALNQRQRSVEQSRRFNRERAASRRALRNASSRKPIKPATKADPDEDKSEGEGFFGRAGRWLERNVVPDLDSGEGQAE